LDSVDLALQKLDEAINIDSNNDYLYHIKAYIAHKSIKYDLAIECYKKSIEINPDNYIIFINWASTLLLIAHFKNNINSYKEEIESILQKAEAIKEGSGSYNLACLYSLLGQKDVALTWLKKDLEHGPTQTIEHILSDQDLNNIKSDSRFNELLDKYYPKE